MPSLLAEFSGEQTRLAQTVPALFLKSAPRLGHAEKADINSTVADAVRFVSAGTSAPGIHYVHADHLGSPQKMTDANQALVWDAVYTPFGQVHSITGTATNNQRFPGQYADAETGFNYNYFRDYDPTTGRYLESDPFGLNSGLNTYAYVGGNPMLWIDPTGLSKWYPIPGYPGWDVRRDPPHHPKDYAHDHNRKRGKEIPRKVDPKKGTQKKHKERNCPGEDKDVPQEVIDAANQSFDVTGDPSLDLKLLELSELFLDFSERLNDFFPHQPPFPIPMPGPLPLPIYIIP